VPRSVLLAAFAIVATVAAAATQDLPQPSGRINDFAGVLDQQGESQLDSLLAALETDTTAQVAVVTMDSLDGANVEEYATTLFNAWGIGQKGTDNGVLVLVVPSERVMRIEVGYGLEGILPDGLAGAVIRDSFLPSFRNDDYQTGIVTGVRRVAEIVRRNETVTAEQLQALQRAAQPSNPPWLGLVLLVFFSPMVAIGSYFVAVGLGARMLFGLVFGLMFGGIGLLLSWGTMPLLFWINSLVAIALFVFGWRKTRSKAFVASLRSGSKGSGWVIGSGTSGRSGSGGGGRSGGSFGGGRSGGGGATGRW
jgi:uncharacterized protein